MSRIGGRGRLLAPTYILYQRGVGKLLLGAPLLTYRTASRPILLSPPYHPLHKGDHHPSTDEGNGVSSVVVESIGIQRPAKVLKFTSPIPSSNRHSRRMNSFTSPSLFGSLGVTFHPHRSLRRISLVYLDVSPKKRTYRRASQRTYRERCCVHACTLLYTRGYTVVYTRVHFSLLYSTSTLGKSTPRTQMSLSLGYAPPPRLLSTLVISCLPLGLYQRNM